MSTGHSEAEPLWVEFLRGLARRALRGAKLLVSDAHPGLKAGITKARHDRRCPLMIRQKTVRVLGRPRAGADVLGGAARAGRLAVAEDLNRVSAAHARRVGSTRPGGPPPQLLSAS